MKSKKLLCLLFTPLLLVGCSKDAPKYTISFDANGGTGTMENVVMEAGSYVLPECTFTAPENKEFSSWLVGEEEREVGYTIDVASDLSIKANWVVSTLATVKGYSEVDLSMYGMGKYSVGLELKLFKDKTASYTITYNDYPFVFNDIVWEDLTQTAGYINVKLPEIDSDTNQEKASRVDTPIYVNDSTYYGLISTNLDALVGKVVVSTNENVSVSANLKGELDLYGLYHETVTLTLLSDSNALYSIDLGDYGAFVVPTKWTVDQETGAVTFPYVIANGETVETKIGSILMGTNQATGEIFATSTVDTSLGAVAISTHSFVTSLTGGTVLDYSEYGMGVFTCNVTLDIYANGWAVQTLDYGESGKFSLVTTYTTVEGSESLSLNYNSISPEGEISIIPVTITFSDGVYSATVPTNLGNVEVSSRPAQ